MLEVLDNSDSIPLHRAKKKIISNSDMRTKLSFAIENHNRRVWNYRVNFDEGNFPHFSHAVWKDTKRHPPLKRKILFYNYFAVSNQKCFSCKNLMYLTYQTFEIWSEWLMALLVRLITSYFCFALFSSLICVVRDCAHTVGGSS